MPKDSDQEVDERFEKLATKISPPQPRKSLLIVFLILLVSWNLFLFAMGFLI